MEPGTLENWPLVQSPIVLWCNGECPKGRYDDALKSHFQERFYMRYFSVEGLLTQPLG
jgi:hypothetical protein